MLNTKEENLSQEELFLLQNYENNLIDINLKISEQNNKKNEIICFFNTFNETNNSNTNFDIESFTEQTSKISESIDSNIESLNLLKDFLMDINASFVNPFKDTSDNSNVFSLRDKIDKYFLLSDKIKNNINLTDISIDNFVKQLNSSNIKDVKESYSDNELQYEDNNSLVISEKDNKVFLPYTISEIKSYMEKYPKDYKSLEHVINKEFILPLDYYTKHPSLSRFREAYSLIRDREAKSVFDALKYGLNVMFNYDLNPAIISACKTEEALNLYIECLENKDLSKFDLFKIEFKLNPFKSSKFEI